jgi:glycosyltransferase involved in cell wall biosynthesis
MPRISVIITTKNRAEQLKNAINSVMLQTFTDFELIVVDDGSTDSTQKLMDKYRDPRVRYFKRKRSRGIQAIAKNKGTKEAKGDFIAYLDDDNTYRPDHLSVLYKVLESRPDCVVSYGDRWIHTPDGKEGIGVFNDFSPSLLMHHNYIDTSDALIRREALDYVGGWDERFKRMSDWNLFLRMSKAGYKMVHIAQILTDYYLGKDNLSYTTEAEMFDPYDCEIRLPYLGKNKDIKPKVAIFSITYNRLEYTRKSFRSLFNTAEYDYDHFIVDNGSTDGTKEWLEKHYSNLVLNKDNKGISIASNQALELIKQSGSYDIIVKFDNDCMCLSKGWLKKMVEIYNSNHMIALSCYVQGLRDNPGGAPRIGYGRIRGELVGMTKHLGGICHFVSSKAYDEWRWSEEEQLHGIQDLEFSRYLLTQGYQMGYLENFFVSHGPMGTAAQQKDYPEYFSKRKLEKVRTYERKD